MHVGMRKEVSGSAVVSRHRGGAKNLICVALPPRGTFKRPPPSPFLPPSVNMLPSSLPAALCAVLLITAHAVSAAPPTAGAASDARNVKRLAISLKAPTSPKTTEEIRAWARRQAENLRRKYNAVGYEEKRASSASVPLTDANVDLQYFGAIQVVRVFLSNLSSPDICAANT